MIQLDRKVFGQITTKEIIGAEPPAIPDTKNILEKELTNLIKELGSQPQNVLEKFLEKQHEAEKHINTRPGAMALAQNKIQLFNEYNQKYVQEIKKRLKV